MLYTYQTIKTFIPDGDWEGFYIYSSKDGEHRMRCYFMFKEGYIKGYGGDDIGNFEWDGTYDDELNINLIKIYARHTVQYTGYADENGIWGTWVILNKAKGGFHIWPKKNKSFKADLSKKQTAIPGTTAITP